MARKLPWESTEDTPGPSPKTETPRVKSMAPASIGRSTPTTISRPHAHSRLRSPSTSPPPEPPAQLFMVPFDDEYRMVEDELLATARQFTTHLHRAEYTRLKELTRSQNADTIREIERPVVGGLTSAARTKKAVATRNVKQGREGWGSLQGLMERGDEGGMGLMRDVVGRDRTRAGAGFVRRNDMRERARLSGGLGEEEHKESKGVRGGLRLSSNSRGKKRVERDNIANGNGEKGVEDEDENEDEDEVDEDDPFGLNRRRVKRIQSREQMKAKVEKEKDKDVTLRLDTIPLFL